MLASLVIVLHVPAYLPVCVHEALKLMAPIAFVLQYGVEGFNMGIEIWHLNRGTLMYYPQDETVLLELVRYKLRAIVGPKP